MINIFLRLTTLPALCQSRQWRWFSFLQLSQNYLIAKKSQVNIEALLVQNESFRCRSWRSGRAQVAVEDGGARGRRAMRIWRRRRRKKNRRSTMSMKETLASLRFGKQIVLEWGISSKVENADGERERARRAALLDWDGDYSHFQRDEVQPVVTCQYIGTCHQDDLQDVKKFPKVNFWSRQRRRRRSHLQNQSTSESAGDYRRFFPLLLFWKNFTLNFISIG